MRFLERITRHVLPLLAIFSATAIAAELPEQSYICVEADTGAIVSEQLADLRRPPASMIKLVLMLMVAEGIDSGQWTPETMVPVSDKAQHMGGTQVYLNAGESWPLEHLMKAVAIASANDAAMAVAEGLWGSEEAYRDAVGKRTAALGMTNTRFFSVHGLPPDKGEAIDETTARDMATLARACTRLPRLMSWVREKEFQFRPGQAIDYNTNKMLWRMEECDGLKTGFIRAAGYCVTATAKRNDTRLIVVILGSPNSNGRFALAKSLFEEGFSRIRRVRVAQGGQPVSQTVPVPCGSMPLVQLHARQDLWVTVQPAQESALQVVFDAPPTLAPPIAQGTDVGEMWVELDGKALASTPLYVAENVKMDLWSVIAAAAPRTPE